MIGEAQQGALCSATNTADASAFRNRVRQASPLRVAACSDKELEEFFKTVCAKSGESGSFIDQAETETTDTPLSSLRQGHATRRSSKRGNKRGSLASSGSLLEVLSAQRGLMEEERQQTAQSKTRVQADMESSRAYAEANAEQQIYMRRLAGGAERITSREEHIRVFHKDTSLAEANAQGLGLNAAKLQVLKSLGIPTQLRLQVGVKQKRQFFTPIFSLWTS